MSCDYPFRFFGILTVNHSHGFKISLLPFSHLHSKLSYSLIFGSHLCNFFCKISIYHNAHTLVLQQLHVNYVRLTEINLVIE